MKGHSLPSGSRHTKNCSQPEALLRPLTSQDPLARVSSRQRADLSPFTELCDAGSEEPCAPAPQELSWQLLARWGWQHPLLAAHQMHTEQHL